MFLYPVYKAIKLRLALIAPVYLYIGQYKPGKDNTSYSIPAIYIELPKNVPVNVYPRKIMSSAFVNIQIHFIGYAPFKNADNAQQEAAVEGHEAILKQIDTLLNGWNVKDTAGKNVTEAFGLDNVNPLNFEDKAVYSILEYKTQVHSLHLT